MTKFLPFKIWINHFHISSFQRRIISNMIVLITISICSSLSTNMLYGQQSPLQSPIDFMDLMGNRNKEAIKRGLPPSEPNPYLSFGSNPNLETYNAWESYINYQQKRRNAGLRSINPEGIAIIENEITQGENDTPENGISVPNFGSAPGENSIVSIAGISGEEEFVEFEIMELEDEEDDGSIDLANKTKIRELFQTSIFEAEVGDGMFGAAGDSTGDFDFYCVHAEEGWVIEVDVDTPEPFEDLDPFVAIYDEEGVLLAFNDDGGIESFDSFLKLNVESEGAYFVMVSGFGSFIPLDPFDSSSGFGAGSEGEYTVKISTFIEDDDDYFLLDLRKGDVFGASINGRSNPFIGVSSPDGSEFIASRSGGAAFGITEDNPLEISGQTLLTFIAPEDGSYAIRFGENLGSYEGSFQVTRPFFELSPGFKQVIFLDFNGGTFDLGEFFGQPFSDIRQLSAFGDFLPNLGISTDPFTRIRLIRRIVNVVRENLEQDLERSEINPNLDIVILNNFGIFEGLDLDRMIDIEERPVSRVIIGGTIEQSGIGTIGIAQSIDQGNFATEELALVLMDIITSRDTSQFFSFNNIPLAPGTSIEDLLVVGLGNIISHEIGHYLGNWHTDGFDDILNIMDEGPGGPGNLIGLGPSGIFGAEDAIDVDFVADTFSLLEQIFVGVEDTRVVTSFGLSFIPMRGTLFAVSNELAKEMGQLNVPKETMLSQNFPNPLHQHESSEIGFTTKRDGLAVLKVYDLSGNEMGTLFNGAANSGEVYQVTLDTDQLHLQPGVYVYKLQTQEGEMHKKFVVQR